MQTCHDHQRTGIGRKEPEHGRRGSCATQQRSGPCPLLPARPHTLSQPASSTLSDSVSPTTLCKQQPQTFQALSHASPKPAKELDGEAQGTQKAGHASATTLTAPKAFFLISSDSSPLHTPAGRPDRAKSRLLASLDLPCFDEGVRAVPPPLAGGVGALPAPESLRPPPCEKRTHLASFSLLRVKTDSKPSETRVTMLNKCKTTASRRRQHQDSDGEADRVDADRVDGPGRESHCLHVSTDGPKWS
eukprot:683142-Rhodomonas_salina.29